MSLQNLTDSSLPGGNDCFNLSALSESVTDSVYKYLLQRTLNFVMPLVEFFLILTLLASFLRAVNKKSLISLISFGCNQHNMPSFMFKSCSDREACTFERKLAQEAGSQTQGAADMRICQTYHLDQRDRPRRNLPGHRGSTQQ